MSQEITTQQVCVLIIGGLEFWIPAEKKEMVNTEINKPEPRFIEIRGETINKGQIVGIFSPDTMEDQKRLKLGQWKCQKGVWHDRNQKCTCSPKKYKKTAYVGGKKITYESDIPPEK
tara:strand:+ start:572 stop:922 length:351 start_codon:yes stop_codon:yes gene_type:complete